MERAEQDYKKIVVYNEYFKKGNLSALQQIKNIIEKEKRYLQLIQDFKQKIRHNIKGRLKADLASIGRLEISMMLLADRININNISNQVSCRSTRPEFSPAVYHVGAVINISMDSSVNFNIPCENSGGK